MNRAKVLGQVRHLLTALGVYFVAEGRLDESTAQQIVGGVVALIGFVWSLYAPEKKETNK